MRTLAESETSRRQQRKRAAPRVFKAIQRHLDVPPAKRQERPYSIRANPCSSNSPRWQPLVRICNSNSAYGKGLERLPRLFALQRERAKIRADQAANWARIARDKQEIGETEMQLLTLRQEDKERANEELTKVRAGLAELRSQLPSRTDVLSRTVIAAPIAGTVMNVRVTTEAGVVGPGEPLLDIVPAETRLIIDARVKPIDIDTIRPGMRARVLLTAYRQRNLPQVHGNLRTISADRLIDDRSGEAYFLAKVEVDRAELGRMRDVRLSPGMPAEVMILTGEQTLLDYLLRPLLDSLTKGLRED